MRKSCPIRFITNGTKFSIEYLEKEIEYEPFGFWSGFFGTKRRIEKSVWRPICQYSGDTLTGFHKYRMVFDSLDAAQQWSIDQNKKEEVKIKNETWKVVE